MKSLTCQLEECQLGFLGLSNREPLKTFKLQNGRMRFGLSKGNSYSSYKIKWKWEAHREMGYFSIQSLHMAADILRKFRSV